MQPLSSPNDALGRALDSHDALDPRHTLKTDDVAGAVTPVADPNGLTTTCADDGFNDVIQVTGPDTGTTTYQYDAAGNESAKPMLAASLFGIFTMPSTG